jgi:hypothetical protein
MAEDRDAAQRSHLHSALAVGLPFFFMQALDAIVRGGIFSGTSAGPVGTLVVVLLSGLSRTIAANVFERERISGAIPLLRELVVTLAACLVLLILLTGRPFRGDFDPLKPDMAWPMVLCTAQWLLTFSVKEALRARDLFLGLIAGKTGHALVSAAHDAGGEAGLAHEAFARLKTMAIVLQIFALLPWVVYQVVLVVIGAPGSPFPLTARLMANAVAGVMFMTILRGFADELACRGAGVSREDEPVARRFGAPLAGVAVLFLAAATLAGSRSLIPLSVLGRLLDWINGLNRGTSLPTLSQALPEGGAPARPGSSMESMLPPVETSPVWEQVFRIAGIVLAVAAAAGFLFFLVRPLLRRGLLVSARRLHPLAAAARAITSLLRLLSGMPSRVARWLRAPGKGFASIPRAILESLREAAAPVGTAARARERAVRVARGRAVREFRRLSRWGERTGIGLSDAEGPMEYAVRLLQRAPAKAAAIREAARVFERLVYSPNPEPKGERALALLIDGIIR